MTMHQSIVRTVAVAALCLGVAGPSAALAQSTSDPASTTQPSTDPSSGSAADASSAGVDGSVRLVVDPNASQASYHAHEQLAGHTLPSEAVGTTHGVNGTIVLGPDGSPITDQSQITVDLSALQSDESRRDNYIKSNTLETNQFPTATFVLRQVQGLATPLPTSGSATLQLLGDLTVHGVTRAATWQVAAQFGDAGISGDATTTVNISDFGMTPPKAGPVLSIEDAVTLELALTANRAG